MRYSRTYKDHQRGITTTHPTRDPYGWRRDRAEDDPSWLLDLTTGEPEGQER